MNKTSLHRPLCLLLAALCMLPMSASMAQHAAAADVSEDAAYHREFLYNDPLYGASANPALPKSISVSKIKSVSKSFSGIPDEFFDELRGKKSISLRTFENYVKEYKLTGQFAQRFFNNHFVFRGGENGLEYIPVKNSLPKNSYNWNNLRHYKSGEVRYAVNGAAKSIKGIDVSSYQGKIDWRKVKKDGVKFAFIRLGYRGYGTGKIIIDERFEENVKNADAAGVKVGVYFYTQAVNTKEAIEEANVVIKHLSGKKISYPVVFDIEDAPSTSARTHNLSKAQAMANVGAFCKRIEDAGYKPMIYANAKWFVSRLDYAQLGHYDKWLAQYYGRPFFPYKFQFWQYTAAGKVSGISGGVDMNIKFI